MAVSVTVIIIYILVSKQTQTTPVEPFSPTNVLVDNGIVRLARRLRGVERIVLGGRMMGKRLLRMMAAAVGFVVASPSWAVPMTSIGAGTAVTTADLTATFDGLSSGQDLTNYTEGGLRVTAPGTHCCLPGVHYESSGNTEFVTIATVDGSDFFGLEFDFGTGFISQLHNVVWETLRDGTVTGSGTLTDIFAWIGLQEGFSVLGWQDVALFDTLRVGAGPAAAGGFTYTAFGQFQAIALDNVRVQLQPTVTAVPEPATLWVFGLGLGGLVLMRRRHRS